MFECQLLQGIHCEQLQCSGVDDCAVVKSVQSGALPALVQLLLLFPSDPAWPSLGLKGIGSISALVVFIMPSHSFE